MQSFNAYVESIAGPICADIRRTLKAEYAADFHAGYGSDVDEIIEHYVYNGLVKMIQDIHGEVEEYFDVMGDG